MQSYWTELIFPYMYMKLSNYYYWSLLISEIISELYIVFIVVVESGSLLTLVTFMILRRSSLNPEVDQRKNVNINRKWSKRVRRVTFDMLKFACITMIRFHLRNDKWIMRILLRSKLTKDNPLLGWPVSFEENIRVLEKLGVTIKKN